MSLISVGGPIALANGCWSFVLAEVSLKLDYRILAHMDTFVLDYLSAILCFLPVCGEIVCLACAIFLLELC